MSARRLPVRPTVDQLKHQAMDLLRALRANAPEAIADLKAFHPEPLEPDRARLADAQLLLARSYQAASWPRLVHAVTLADAIWDDDIETIRRLVTANAHLLREDVLLLEHGADPSVRASLRKELHSGYDIPGRHDYHDVTALSWGRRFHAPIFVSEPAMRLIEAAGGAE